MASTTRPELHVATTADGDFCNREPSIQERRNLGMSWNDTSWPDHTAWEDFREPATPPLGRWTLRLPHWAVPEYRSTHRSRVEPAVLIAAGLSMPLLVVLTLLTFPGVDAPNFGRAALGYGLLSLFLSTLPLMLALTYDGLIDELYHTRTAWIVTYRPEGLTRTQKTQWVARGLQAQHQQDVAQRDLAWAAASRAGMGLVDMYSTHLEELSAEETRAGWALSHAQQNVADIIAQGRGQATDPADRIMADLHAHQGQKSTPAE